MGYEIPADHHQDMPMAKVAVPLRDRGADWHDISNEKSRTYHFPDGATFTVYAPSRLHVTKKPEGDSHRIERKNGHGVYIRSGWIAIEWDGPIDF